LREVSFEVKEGEVLGVIGRNGAGKSTLLKILSRITEPTEGSIRIRGRVASLLEVGTGFHPELTGRENIYLNGAILGMHRAEIKAKFDEIVAFAEVERFLDTPVKRYSSGMYVRLAFAVAAHLEPEILIIDEVLAVGDAQFQKKCLGKMKDVAQGGRTVLFVSHNMGVIGSLCRKAILVHAGNLVKEGKASDVVGCYLSSSATTNTFRRNVMDCGKPRLIAASINVLDSADGGEALFDVTISTPASKRVSIDLRLFDVSGTPVGFGSIGALDQDEMIPLHVGENTFQLSLDLSHLANGAYTISFDLTEPTKEYFDRVEHVLRFSVARTPRGRFGRVSSQDWGNGSYELPLRLTSTTLGIAPDSD
jgi:lipopolysaccharide transport system ATP-binding protein